MVCLFIVQDITCVLEYEDEILFKPMFYLFGYCLDTQHVWASSCTFYNCFHS